jgi:CheY-like chemotaxis protein
MHTILIAEDDLLIRELLERFLEIIGYRVILASNGREAVDLATAHTPALILMDIGMPLMNGLEAIQLIKADPRISHIPIIVLSAYAFTEDRTKAEAVGCDAFATKPIDLPALREQIGSLVAGSLHKL